jgi:protein gp37
MGQNTGIEWTDSTVNPIIGCEGCELWSPNMPEAEQHCYAASLTKRYCGRSGWPDSFGEPQFFPSRVENALKWPDLTGTDRPGKPWLNGLPRLIFLNDLSDTFIKDPSPWGWLPDYIPAMEKSPHVWIFLTKRARTMYRFFKDYGRVPGNFWLGATVTGAGSANRLLDLMKIKELYPDATTWLSAEPLLGDVVTDFRPKYTALSWVVTGGESGHNARPCHPDWARALREWSLCWGIPFFWKQWGEWISPGQEPPGTFIERDRGFLTTVKRGHRIEYLDSFGKFRDTNELDDFRLPGDWVKVARVGKKAAGRLLDGRTWDELSR